MTICVDIADRLYDYTDEEKATQAVEDFQSDTELSDTEILTLWTNAKDPRRLELERRILNAVNLNGSLKRAYEHTPAEISLIQD